MSADIQAYLQIDDNTPADLEPFTYDPSTWDLSSDLGLCGCKDYAFFASISGIRNVTDISPLIALRGLPQTNNTHDPIFQLSDDLDDSAVGWLTLGEIQAAMDHMSVDRTLITSHVMRVLECMATLERLVGKDRVRLVFSVHD
ncbi:hypothetical protein [Symmachiella dynata]|uniref:hypothetical protein n=1 Tax=Symmachiella dynata TaxID=2527995 RepID=UPI0030ECF673|tara:strand:- start:419 stop:847 length:429 start_codon:yes stop_codon:yes gene_type:complete